MVFGPNGNTVYSHALGKVVSMPSKVELDRMSDDKVAEIARGVKGCLEAERERVDYMKKSKTFTVYEASRHTRVIGSTLKYAVALEKYIKKRLRGV